MFDEQQKVKELIKDIDNFLQSIETKQVPETKLEPRYELIRDFESPLKTIKKARSKQKAVGLKALYT